MKKFFASLLAAFSLATSAKAQAENNAIPPIRVDVADVTKTQFGTIAELEYSATPTYINFAREELLGQEIYIQSSEDLQTFGPKILSVTITEQFLDILEKKAAGEELSQHERGLIRTNPGATDVNNDGKMFFRLNVPDAWVQETETQNTAQATAPAPKPAM
jgi:hypothetical protein